MSGRSRAPFGGRLESGGFAVDVAHVGQAEAYRRVAAAWAPGARLLASGHHLVLVLPEPVSMRAERAPGLPLVRRASGWAVPRPGADPEPVADLPEVDLTGLVDLDGLEVVALDTVPGVPEPEVVVERPARRRSAPSLRSRAGVGEADHRVGARARRMVEDLSGDAQRRTRLEGWWSSRRPMTPVLRRRHARYLERLTADFQRRDWEQALRSAIPVGGTGGGYASVRVPRRRSGPLVPSTRARAGGAAINYGATVQGHLHQLYRAAADQLEADGDHLRAAFVHADLLDNPTAAIDVLERHGRHREAAELAEARGQDPAVAVRLWWRAGERARAIDIAITRGAFAAAIARLEASDESSARELRREWMLARREAGDPLGALAAAWPSASLRDETLPDLATGIAAGGRVAAVALAHWLEHAPTPEGVATAREILDVRAEHVGPRRVLIAELAGHPVGEPAWDRELSSAALLAVVRGHGPLATRAHHDAVAALSRRADRLLVADLPSLRPGVLDPQQPAELDLTRRGDLVVHDAAAIGTSSVLVALGEAGVRLLTLDGRVRATWDVPTHRLVVADHGTRVLLVTDRSPRFGVHALDLPQGRPVPLPPLDVMPLRSYDGAQPVLVSERGVEWVTLRDGRWHLAWRELVEPDDMVHLIARAPDAMAALVTTGRALEVWRWELPSHTLRGRQPVEASQAMAVTALGQLGRFHAQSGVATLDWFGPMGDRVTSETLVPEGDGELLVSGHAFARADHTERGSRLTLHPASASPEVATILLPAGERPLFRSDGERITAGHAGGRVVVVDTSDNRVTADLTIRA
jgi:hypothetical protein